MDESVPHGPALAGPAEPLKPSPQRRLLRWMGAAAIAAVLLPAVVLIFVDRAQRIDLAGDQALRSVQGLAADLEQALALATMVADQTEARVLALAPGEPLESALAQAGLGHSPLEAALPWRFGLRLLDAQGRVVAGEADEGAPGEGAPGDHGPGAPRPPAAVPNTVPHTVPATGATATPAVPAARWQVLPLRPGARRLTLWHAVADPSHRVAALALDFALAPLDGRLQQVAARHVAGGVAQLWRLDAAGALQAVVPVATGAMPAGQEGALPEPSASLLAAELGARDRGWRPLLQADATGLAVGDTASLLAWQRLAGEARGLVLALHVEQDAVLATWRAVLPRRMALLGMLLGLGMVGMWRLERALRAAEASHLAMARSEAQMRAQAVALETRVAERTAQLQASEQRYRRIFEAVPVAIHEQDWSGARRLINGLRAQGVSDPAGHFARHPEFVRQCLRAVRVLKVNDKAVALRRMAEVDGQPLTLESVFDTPEGVGDFIGELLAFWNGQRHYTWQRRQTLPDGSPLNLMLSMSLPSLDEDSDGTALVCFIDITEVDRLNAELDATLASVRRVNRELETFTYSVSHDLKAPLRGIDGYGRLLLRDHAQQLNDEGRQFLGHIRQATQQMGQLIDDLLSYSRLERRSIELADVALAPLAQAVADASADAARQRGATVRLAVPPGLRARADARGLEIALRNLLDNALKFGRPDVPLTIELGGEPLEGGAVTLWVRDNGIGFDMRFHDRIFEIFQRLHRAEDYPGTGVGLAIVRKAMERMGGTIRAEGRPGEGAIFRLEIPGSR